MTQYDRTNSGALFKNDRKERETHADYKGHINVAGQEYWLSAWLKKDRNGRTFMSLSVQPKEGAPKQQATAAGAAADYASAKSKPAGEPRRDCRRLPLLRVRSHHDETERQYLFT